MKKLFLSLFAAATMSAQAPTQRPVVIASKPFGESYILAEMFSQLLESRGFAVTRRFGFGATEVAVAALRSGGIDAYPEYTGTGLVAVLHDSLGDLKCQTNDRPLAVPECRDIPPVHEMYSNCP